MAEGILCIDQAGSISFENPAAARLLGWNAGELIGRSAGSTFRPRPGNGNAKGGGLKSMHSENDRRVDNEVFWRRDGTSFPVEYTSTAVQNDGGELIGEVLVFNDITERRRTQEELLHSRTMLQTIVDHLPQRVFWKGTDLAYIGCNRPFAQDAGLASPAEIIGKTDFDFCWRESAERYRKDDAEVMATRTAKSQYMEMQDRGDGSIAWLRTSKVPFYDNEGRVFAVLGTYEDVTELQHAEVALQESEERFRLGFEFAGIGMALVSLQGHWLKVNEKICEILGYSSEDLLVTTFQELSHPEDLDADLHEVGRLIAGELRSYQIEKRYFHKKGHVVFAFLTASIVRNAAGEALYFISQVEDITERKRNEAVQKKLAAELAGERRHLHEILNSVPAVVFETCNPAAAHRSTDFVSNYVETMYGYTAQEWLSTPGFSLSRVHPEDQPRLMEVISEVFAGRRVNSQLVFRVLARDGRVVWGETHLVAMHDEAGTLLGIRGVTLDVSERMHAQQELQWKTALLEAQVDATLDGILVVDSQGKQIVQSRQFTRMWNLPQHILDAQDDEMILQFAVNSTTEPEQFLKKITYLYDHLDETSHDEIELTNGSVFDRYSAPVLGKDGTYYGRIWTFRDISDRRRAEMEMERMHKQFLEVSRQAGMTEVATSVLHNVGNVLNSVNVSCAVVSDKVRRSRIGSVAKTAELLQAHTDDLGAFFCSHPTGMKLPGFFSKLSERLLEEQVAVLHELELLGRNIEHIKEIVAMQQSYANVSGVREKLFLKDLVEDTLRMNGAALNRHQLDIVREFEEVPAISMEKHKVLQILVNLIKNAKQSLAESQHPHKQLIVRIARSGPAFVAVSVSDNGIGIPAENLTRIFGHGFTTKKEGHGFGLHSGVLAAQQMGGSLSVRSAGPGRGATFTLELPIENIGHH
ncbi:MAG: PAS domain S-box protein [Verrucomicrobiota bacterium]